MTGYVDAEFNTGLESHIVDAPRNTEAAVHSASRHVIRCVRRATCRIAGLHKKLCQCLATAQACSSARPGQPKKQSGQESMMAGSIGHSEKRVLLKAVGVLCFCLTASCELTVWHGMVCLTDRQAGPLQLRSLHLRASKHLVNKLG